MITGTVKFFNTDKGYGFIAPEGGGDDAFVHISAVERAGMHTLNKDQRVSYELETDRRSEEHTSELQSLMRISYAVFCLKKKKKYKTIKKTDEQHENETST